MLGKIALDTNVVIRLFKQEPQVLTRFASAGLVVVPAAVVGELYYGAERSNRADDHRSQIVKFLAAATVAAIDAETAVQYGRIKAALRRKGKPIPENDIWVAASALRYELPLATTDAHFQGIDGLQTEVW